MEILNGFYLPTLARFPSIYWSADFIGFVAIPAASIFILKRLKGLSPADYGFCASDPDYSAAQFLNDLFISFCLLGMSAFLLPKLLWPYLSDVDGVASMGTSASYKSMLPNGVMRTPTILYLSLSASLVEELYFRGLLKRLLMTKSGSTDRRIAYLATSSALFAVSHWEQGLTQMASMLVYGIVSCWIYLQTRTLYPLIATHCAIDIIEFS